MCEDGGETPRRGDAGREKRRTGAGAGHGAPGAGSGTAPTSTRRGATAAGRRNPAVGASGGIVLRSSEPRPPFGVHPSSEGTGPLTPEAAVRCADGIAGVRCPRWNREPATDRVAVPAAGDVQGSDSRDGPGPAGKPGAPGTWTDPESGRQARGARRLGCPAASLQAPHRRDGPGVRVGKPGVPGDLDARRHPFKHCTAVTNPDSGRQARGAPPATWDASPSRQ